MLEDFLKELYGTLSKVYGASVNEQKSEAKKDTATEIANKAEAIAKEDKNDRNEAGKEEATKIADEAETVAKEDKEEEVKEYSKLEALINRIRGDK